jgi:hypothetical protein
LPFPRPMAACSGDRARMSCLLSQRSKGVGTVGGFFLRCISHAKNFVPSATGNSTGVPVVFFYREI